MDIFVSEHLVFFATYFFVQKKNTILDNAPAADITNKK